MKVALKYCGGCDPAYERTEYFERIRRAAGERIEWTRLDDPGREAVLLICGCVTACPEQEFTFDRPVVALKDDGRDPGEVIGLVIDTIKKEPSHGHQDQG